MGRIAKLKSHVRALRRETHALMLACRDSRMPWYARVWVAIVVGYLFSPIDLIPDFIPVLGYLDDLILVPIGIHLALRMIPHEVMADCRSRVDAHAASSAPKNWVAGGIVLVLWALVAALAVRWYLAGR